MSKSQRLVGIDLCRGIAAYAVVVRHSGDLSWAPVGYGVLEFRAFFDFAVPFFLATSFYLAAQKLDRTGSLYSLGSRFKRLLVPYLFWSLIYICFKAAFFLFNNDTTSFHKLFSDPIGIVFLGASSVQLYFLPWLFVGTCWMMFSKKMLDRKFRIRIQAIFFLLSISVYQILISSGNGFDLASGSAFSRLSNVLHFDNKTSFLTRLILIILAWVIRCIPYIFMAIILNRLLTDQNHYLKFPKHSHSILFLCLFLIVNSIGISFIPTAFREILIAFSLLLLSISISNKLIKNKFFTDLSYRLGSCSFGIYLIHIIFIQFLEAILAKFIPILTENVTIASILILSICSFLISWVIVEKLFLKSNVLRLTISN